MSETLDHRPWYGYQLALGAGVCVGLTPVASKIVLAEMNVLSFGAVWFCVAGLYALAFLGWQRRWPELLLSGRTLAGVVGVGVSNALAGLMYFRAIQISDPALVGFFTRPGTIFIVLGGVIFFGERLSPREWLAIGIVIAGSLLMGYRSTAVDLRAFALTVASTVLTSVSYTLAKDAVATVPPLVVVAYRGISTSLTYLAIALATGSLTVPLGPHLLALGIGAFVGPFLSFVLLFAAFRQLPMGRASVVHAANPIFTAIYARVITGSVLLGSQIAGGLLATAGIALLIAQNPGQRAPGRGDPKAE